LSYVAVIHILPTMSSLVEIITRVIYNQKQLDAVTAAAAAAAAAATAGNVKLSLEKDSVIILILIAPFSILSEDEWEDLECLKASQAATAD